MCVLGGNRKTLFLDVLTFETIIKSIDIVHFEVIMTCHGPGMEH